MTWRRKTGSATVMRWTTNSSIPASSMRTVILTSLWNMPRPVRKISWFRSRQSGAAPPHPVKKMFDENEFLSPYGIRSVSKFHAQNPCVLHMGGQDYRVDYLPAESNTGMFGGNSNWRGAVWMPVNAIIIRALL